MGRSDQFIIGEAGSDKKFENDTKQDSSRSKYHEVVKTVRRMTPGKYLYLSPPRGVDIPTAIRRLRSVLKHFGALDPTGARISIQAHRNGRQIVIRCIRRKDA